MTPTVSVLIPAYNASATLGSSLESLVRQTFRDFEVVTVDDGSTDDTAAILQEYQQRHGNFRTVNGTHQGIIGALNLGIEHCRGEFIARMDADDISHPKRLEMQVKMLKSNPRISVCSSLVRCFPLTDVQGGLRKYEEWLNSVISPEEIARDMFIESPVAHPSVMLRRQELVELGGYEEHGWPEDYDLWLRYHMSGRIFAKTPETLVFWRAGQERLTFTDSRYSLENFLRAKAHYLKKMLGDKHPEVVLWGTGMMGRRLSKHLLREGISIQAVVDVDNKKTGHRMRDIPIVPADYLLERPDAFVVSAVGSAGARALIREYLTGTGRTEGNGYICAA